MKYKVLIPQEVANTGIDFLRENNCECVFLEDCSVENMCNNVKDCDAILARTATFNKEVIDAGEKLKIIARHGVGLDNVDVEYAKHKGIKVTVTPGANSNSVAEHAIALILACAKQIPFFDKNVRNYDWTTRDTMKTRDLSGNTLGIVGYGRISSMVAKKAALGMDMKVLVYRNHHEVELPEYITEVDTMEEIFEKSDYISFHMPLREDTVGIVNKDMFDRMKPTAYFINTARGGSVNETDLYNVLKEKRIAGAAIDVLADEPPIRENKLFELDNLIITPHNAAHTYDSMDRMSYNAACEIVRVLNGEEPLWEV